MKFKSKSLISIILSIMMVISMIIVAIPANAAVIVSEPVGAGEYYLWYGIGVDQPGSIKTKVQLTTNDSVTYEGTADFNAVTSTWNKIYLNQSDSNAYTSPVWTDASFTCTISDDITDKVASAIPGTYNYNGTNLGMFTLNLNSGAGAVSIKFSYNKDTKIMTISAAGTEPTVTTTETTVATTTTPATGEWFLIGGGGPGDNIFGAYDTKNTDYQLSGTGTVLSRSVTFAKGKTYFRFHDKNNQYSLNTNTEEEIGDYNNKKQLVESSAKALIFNNVTGSDQTVNICLDTSTTPPTVWYESSTGPIEPTEGDFKIVDKTAANGKLTFSAPNKAAGTADLGDTVEITATPDAYFSLSKVKISYTDANGESQTLVPSEIANNKCTFTIPSDATFKKKEISVKGTFTLTSSGKLNYVKAKGSGLYIDVAPTQNDTTATLIKWNNYKGQDQGTNNPYTFYVPKNVDLTNAVIYNTTGSQITLGGKTINNNEKAEGVNLTVGDNTITGYSVNNVKVMQGSTDAMFLHTTKEDGTDFDLPTKRNWPTDKGVTDKQASEYKATIESSGGSCTTMDNTSGTANFSSAMGLDTVKGRGNSSWKASATMFGKYAFNMKLKSKTNLLGMDSTESEGAKSWCLLANNADESMLRNALTYQLASEIGLLYSPEFRFVDIYDNGEYMGSYLVTEKVDVGSSKLVKGKSFEDINETAAGTVVEDAVTNETYSYGGKTHEMSYAKVTSNGNTSSIASKTDGKYLLEFEITERYKDEASWFTSPRGQHVVVKSPEFATKEQVTYIAQKFAAMEDIVYNSSATKAQLSSVMDVESFAKMYLIQEFSSNLDAASTSYYLTFDCSKNDANGNGAVFVANPVWDYDWAYGQYTNTSDRGAKKPVSGNDQDEYLQTNNPQKWVAKYKSMDDSKGGSAYSIQSQLASQNSDFKAEIRKQWEGTNGFYTTIKKYYGADGQIMTWYNQIKDSVDMNETRWGFIASNPISGWGSTETGNTHEAAVNYLNNTWTAARATWLNKQFTSDEYPAYTPSAPTIKAYAADGTTEISAVEAGSPFIIKVTSNLESGVVYRLYKSGVKVGTDQSDGKFEIATDESMVGSTYTYTVTAVYGGRESSASTGVDITINEKAGNKTVRVYFKSAAASVYVPSFSLDNAAATVMSRTPKTPTDKGTYFGSTYSGSLKFYWFFKDITIDTSVPHTITFTTKNNVNATTSYTFGAATEYYFAVDNLMGDTNLVDLTSKEEYIRNYHISATHMVYSTKADNNAGFTWINGKEYAMGTYLNDNNISTASLADLNSSSLLTIPSALTPNAMLEASSAPAFFTIKSATLAQRITAEAEEVSTLQYQLLDVNLDGVVDVKDSTMMQKVLAGF